MAARRQPAGGPRRDPRLTGRPKPHGTTTRAMNDVASILRDRRFWAGLSGLGLVLGVAGPFGTVISLPLLPRMGYWMFMVYLTGPFGLVCSRLFSAGLRRLRVPDLPAALMAGALTGLPINLVVHAANSVLLSPGDVALSPQALSLSLVGISITISFAVALAFHRYPAPPNATPAPPAHGVEPVASRLLDRLPDDLRAPLVSLEATDHYTRITTDRGSATILLRFSDAIAEAAPTPGLRLHRSHWVALDRIAAVRRDGPRAVVTTTLGHELPVSRMHVPALHAAGLLPPR